MPRHDGREPAADRLPALEALVQDAVSVVEAATRVPEAGAEAEAEPAAAEAAAEAAVAEVAAEAEVPAAAAPGAPRAFVWETARFSTSEYLEGCLWTTQMYVDGVCGDYAWEYSRLIAPSMRVQPWDVVLQQISKS